VGDGGERREVTLEWGLSRQGPAKKGMRSKAGNLSMGLKMSGERKNARGHEITQKAGYDKDLARRGAGAFSWEGESAGLWQELLLTNIRW